MKQIWMAVWSFSLSASAMQTPPTMTVDIGAVKFSGSGCAAGGSVKPYDLAEHVYEVAFDGIILELRNEKPYAEYDSKACNVVLPVSAAAGYKVAVSRISYTGSNDLSSGTESRIWAEAYFSGTRAHPLQKLFFENGEFHTEISLSESEKSWSSCNTDSKLHLNITGEIKGLMSNSNSTTFVDGDIKIKLEVRPCT